MQSSVFAGSNSPTCLSFWYNMYSYPAINMGTLNVYRYNFNDNSLTLLWTLSTSQSISWLEGRISYTYSSLHTIIFEGMFKFCLNTFDLFSNKNLSIDK